MNIIIDRLKNAGMNTNENTYSDPPCKDGYAQSTKVNSYNINLVKVEALN